MPLYEVGMHKEQWVTYEADTPQEALHQAAVDNPEWTVLGANDARGALVSPQLDMVMWAAGADFGYDGSDGPDKEGWDD